MNKATNCTITKCKEIAMDIYGVLGSGYLESVYQKAFEIALRYESIPYEEQRDNLVFYKGKEVGVIRLDLVVGDDEKWYKVIVELKIKPLVGNREISQLQRYMQWQSISKGLLVNFPPPDNGEEQSDTPVFYELVA